MLNLQFSTENGLTDFLPVPAVAETKPQAMQVIVFSSQKGGSGKTTLCGQLAVQAEIVGAGPVAVVDTDPQGSLSDWWNAREAETPLFMKAQVDYLHEDLRQLERTGVKLVFIDTPPAVTDTIRQIVAYADLVVVPTRPSPHDLRAVGATLDIIDGQRKPLIFAVNAASRAKITSDTAVALSQHGTVAPVIVKQRTDFATSMIHGRAVVETNPESRSAGEIADLWRYIASRLDRDDHHVTRGTGVFQQPRNNGFGRRKATAPEVIVR
jgi:chromosome partitioning protein